MQLSDDLTQAARYTPAQAQAMIGRNPGGAGAALYANSASESWWTIPSGWNDPASVEQPQGDTMTASDAPYWYLTPAPWTVGPQLPDAPSIYSAAQPQAQASAFTMPVMIAAGLLALLVLSR